MFMCRLASRKSFFNGKKGKNKHYPERTSTPRLLEDFLLHWSDIMLSVGMGVWLVSWYIMASGLEWAVHKFVLHGGKLLHCALYPVEGCTLHCTALH